MDCKDFDAQVARYDERVQKKLDAFVCVRLRRMRGIDLSQFRFDFDMTWAAFFLDATGRIYARYGSRDGSSAMSHNSIEGLLACMDRVLEAHRTPDLDTALFRGKSAPKPAFRRPELFPAANRGRRRGRNCIHCHNVHEYEQERLVRQKDYAPQQLRRYPPPAAIGLEIDKDDGQKIQKVTAGGIASRAGLAKGDRITKLGGQAIYSIADLVWVLHGAGSEAKLHGELLRGGKRLPFLLPLTKGWRPWNLAWRASLFALPPSPGIWVEDASKRVRREEDLGETELALLVRGLFKAQSRRLLKRHDIIVEIDGSRERRSGNAFHVYVRTHCYKKGSKLHLTILRDGEERKLVLAF